MFGHCINMKITCVCKHLTDFCFFHPIIFIYLYLEESKFILAREGSLFQCWADKHPPILNNRSTIAPLWSPCTPTVQKSQGLINECKEGEAAGWSSVGWDDESMERRIHSLLLLLLSATWCPAEDVSAHMNWCSLHLVMPLWHMSPHRSNWYATLGGQGGCTYISLIIL